MRSKRLLAVAALSTALHLAALPLAHAGERDDDEGDRREACGGDDRRGAPESHFLFGTDLNAFLGIPWAIIEPDFFVNFGLVEPNTVTEGRRAVFPILWVVAPSYGPGEKRAPADDFRRKLRGAEVTLDPGTDHARTERIPADELCVRVTPLTSIFPLFFLRAISPDAPALLQSLVAVTVLPSFRPGRVGAHTVTASLLMKAPHDSGPAGSWSDALVAGQNPRGLRRLEVVADPDPRHDDDDDHRHRDDRDHD